MESEKKKGKRCGSLPFRSEAWKKTREEIGVVAVHRLLHAGRTFDVGHLRRDTHATCDKMPTTLPVLCKCRQREQESDFDRVLPYSVRFEADSSQATLDFDRVRSIYLYGKRRSFPSATGKSCPLVSPRRCRNRPRTKIESRVNG